MSDCLYFVHSENAHRKGVPINLMNAAGPYDALGFDHLSDYAAPPHLTPVRGAHQKPIRVANLYRYLADRRRVAVGPPPSNQMLGLGPAFEHQRARRVEHARNDKDAFLILSFCLHRNNLLSGKCLHATHSRCSGGRFEKVRHPIVIAHFVYSHSERHGR
jgi:hypothetical protein